MTNSYRPGIKKFDWFKASLSIPIQPGTFHTSPGCPAPMFAESVYRVNTTNNSLKLEQISLNNMVLGRRCREITESGPKNQLFLKNEDDVD